MVYDSITSSSSTRVDFQPRRIETETRVETNLRTETDDSSNTRVQNNSFFNDIIGFARRLMTPPDPINPTEEVNRLFGQFGSPGDLSDDEALDLGAETARLFFDQTGAIQAANQILDQLAGTEKSDNFSRGVVENLTDEQLFAIGRTSDGAQFLQRMQDRLLDGSVHQEEEDDAVRLYRAIPSTDINDEGRAVNARSGAEAAAILKNEDNYLTAEWETFRGADFAKVVELRRNDPVFMRELYENLGPELTASLMSASIDAIHRDNLGEYQDESDARSALSAIAQTLSYMPASFQREVGAQAAEQGKYQVGIILGLPEAGDAARRGFVDGAKEMALGDDYDSNYAARMVGEALSGSPRLMEEYLADTTDARGNRTNALWSPEEVTKLFQNGLEVPPIADSFHYDWSLMKGEGLERIVGMAADLRGSEYADFRARLFRDASSVLSETDTGDDMRQSLVDNLKDLFMTDPRGLVDKLFNNTGVTDSPFDSSGQALGLFFRETLFADANPDDPFITTVSQLMGGIRAEMLDVDNLRQDPNNERYAKLLGDVLGSVAAGYKRAVKDNGEDQAAREALVGTIVDLVAKPIDIGGGAVGDIATDQAKKLTKSIFSDFINGDLKADEEGMREILDQLFENAFAGARDFDSRHRTNIEANVKVETIWVDFLRDLF
ncbi:MAG: hypothetical protein ABWZ66_01205 [Pyrinomonadaceae bacterium]